MHRDSLLPYFGLDFGQLFPRGLIVIHRRRRASGERIAYRIDHVDQQQHRVPHPRQFLRAAQGGRRFLREIDGRDYRPERELLRGMQVRGLPLFF